MLQTFENLDAEKKRRILNAAMEEFVAKGYKQATTDDIVARAGISKGALFHYFGSKDRLYVYLMDFVLDTYRRRINERTNFNEPDFFIRLHQMLQGKMEVSIAYPDLVAFWIKARGESSDIVVAHLEKRITALRPQMQDFLANIDYSRFKDSLDIPKTIKVIFWTFEGLSNEIVERAKSSQELLNLEKEFAEVEEYIQYFRILFYKEK